MAKALGDRPRRKSAHAPRIETFTIDKSKIREVIGTGGKVIREIVATTGAKVDIDDEGVIKISRRRIRRRSKPRSSGSRAWSKRPRSARSTTARSSTWSISARS
jgi:polyribonucleotide nucleotidyltransferase